MNPGNLVVYAEREFLNRSIDQLSLLTVNRLNLAKDGESPAGSGVVADWYRARSVATGISRSRANSLTDTVLGLLPRFCPFDVT